MKIVLVKNFRIYKQMKKNNTPKTPKTGAYKGLIKELFYMERIIYLRVKSGRFYMLLFKKSSLTGWEVQNEKA